MMRHPKWLSAAVLCVAYVIALPARTEDDFVLQGTYANAVSDQEKVVAQAIETATEKMNFIKRPIARSRLTKTSPVYKQIRLARTATSFEIQFNDRKPMLLPLSGAPIHWENEEGDKYEVSAVLSNGRLVQNYKSKDGARSNSFRWDAATERLYLDAELSSPQLPQAVKYTLVYKKVE